MNTKKCTCPEPSMVVEVEHELCPVHGSAAEKAREEFDAERYFEGTELAERGTTPPEGVVEFVLEQAAKEAESWSGYDDTTTQRQILCEQLTSKIAAAIRALAATQRAPVEQARDIEHEQLEAEVPYSAEYLRGFNDGCVDGSENADHAREGALLREAKWWYKEFVWPWRADDEDSDDRARKRLAALANGKEGTLR